VAQLVVMGAVAPRSGIIARDQAAQTAGGPNAFPGAAVSGPVFDPEPGPFAVPVPPEPTPPAFGKNRAGHPGRMADFPLG